MYLTRFCVSYALIDLVCGNTEIPLMKNRFKITVKKRPDTFPWVGILLVKQNKLSDAVTGLVLIANKLAIAVAGDVAKINKATMRTTTKAMFYKKKTISWTCQVEDYILHPEYHDDLLNTIAVVKLLDPANSDDFWNPIKWPNSFYKPQQNVYSVGFTDHRKRFEHIVYRMVPFNTTRCKEFYKDEGLNCKELWPSHFKCLKAANNKRTCVFDNGMALATNSSGDWVLLGLGTNGPGCSLPSRYIEFFPYIPWIQSATVSEDTMKTIRIDRRLESLAVEMYNTDQDKIVLNYIDNETIILRPELAHKNLTVYGNCTRRDGRIIYAENNDIDTGKYNPTTALYSVSIINLFLNKVTCVLLKVNCTEMSHTIISESEGFQQVDLSFLVKSVPIPVPGKPIAAKIYYIKESFDKYARLPTFSLSFRFKFVGLTNINIQFYGKHAIIKKLTPMTEESDNMTTEKGATTTTKTTTTTTTTSRPRPTRKYVTSLRPAKRRKIPID